VDCTYSTTSTLPPPVLPADSVYLLKATIVNGAVTAVKDLRQPASFARTGVYDITDPLYGAVGDGTTDDTAAIQAALSANGNVVVCPTGSYKVTSTLEITRAVHFKGLGPRPGSQQTSPDDRWRGCALNHAFNGTFLNIPGISGDVNGPQGTTIENMLLRQVYGNGSAAAGIAINIVKTSATYWATWTRLIGLSNQYDVGVVDDWTYAVVIDGDASSAAPYNTRDHGIYDSWFVCYTNATGCVLFNAVANVQVTNLFLQGDKSDFTLTGADNNHRSSNNMMANVKVSGTLTFDWADYNTCAGCQLNNLTFTTHATGNFVDGNLAISNVTMPAGSTTNVVVAQQGILFNGNNGSFYKLKAPDGFQTRVGVDVEAGVSGYVAFLDGGTEKWRTGKNTDNTWFLVHATLGSVITATEAGRVNFYKATARKWATLTYASPTTVDLSLGDHFDLPVTSNANFTISNPTNKSAGQQVTICVQNIGVGALGTITWSSDYVLAGAFTNPATDKNRCITFMTTSSGSLLREVHRVAADVSN